MHILASWRYATNGPSLIPGPHTSWKLLKMSHFTIFASEASYVRSFQAKNRWELLRIYECCW